MNYLTDCGLFLKVCFSMFFRKQFKNAEIILPEFFIKICELSSLDNFENTIVNMRKRFPKFC